VTFHVFDLDAIVFNFEIYAALQSFRYRLITCCWIMAVDF